MSKQNDYILQTSDKKIIITWDDGDRAVIDIKQDKELMFSFIRDNVGRELTLRPAADNCFRVKIISVDPFVTG